MQNFQYNIRSISIITVRYGFSTKNTNHQSQKPRKSSKKLTTTNKAPIKNRFGPNSFFRPLLSNKRSRPFTPFGKTLGKVRLEQLRYDGKLPQLIRDSYITDKRTRKSLQLNAYRLKKKSLHGKRFTDHHKSLALQTLKNLKHSRSRKGLLGDTYVNPILRTTKTIKPSKNRHQLLRRNLLRGSLRVATSNISDKTLSIFKVVTQTTNSQNSKFLRRLKMGIRRRRRQEKSKSDEIKTPTAKAYVNDLVLRRSTVLHFLNRKARKSSARFWQVKSREATKAVRYNLTHKESTKVLPQGLYRTKKVINNSTRVGVYPVRRGRSTRTPAPKPLRRR